MYNATNLYNQTVAKDFYDKRYETGYMEEWDEAKKNKVKEILQQLNLPATGKALDFGCGNGVFTHLIKTVLPNWQVYGVEISSVAVQNAASKFTSCHFFEAAEANKYANTFDFIFSHHVLEHVPNITATLQTINNYLKPQASQLHILPCGNANSYEYNICILRKDGINPQQENRFFFEEPGHLRRLTTKELVKHQQTIGFTLTQAFYANQHKGAINWITKSSPRFVKKLTDATQAVDATAAKKLQQLRSTLLPLTYAQFAYTKYWQINTKWKKSFKDKALLILLFIPAMISKILYNKLDKAAAKEWDTCKHQEAGSEMYVYFTRN